jgi:trehalose 6-phosphate phosphatase
LRTTFDTSNANISWRNGPGERGRIALFLDVDGTLLDLAERPEIVTVPPGLLASLAAAEARTGGALALISGRTIADLDRLFAPLRLRAAGVHGAELRLDPDDAPSPGPESVVLPTSLRPALDDILRDFPGTFIEDKRFSLAVHYRQAPMAGDALRMRLTRILEAFPQMGVTMLAAHYAFELKSPQFDKGRAVAAFLSTPPFHRRAPIYIGDDDTDEAGFAAVSACGGRAYSVGLSRPGVVATFADPNEVRGWLENFAYGGASA